MSIVSRKSPLPKKILFQTQTQAQPKPDSLLLSLDHCISKEKVGHEKPNTANEQLEIKDEKSLGLIGY